MKTLYLVRHAKSSWKDDTLLDIDRPLNSRGKRDAPFMGKLLHQKGIEVDAFISSPARRAKKTARAFADAFDYSRSKIKIEPLVYEATVSDLFFVLKNWKNDLDSVLLFGHNFSYTEFANLYANPLLDNVPTTGVVAIEFKVNLWENISTQNGRVVFFEYPKKYFPKG